MEELRGNIQEAACSSIIWHENLRIAAGSLGEHFWIRKSQQKFEETSMGIKHKENLG